MFLMGKRIRYLCFLSGILFLFVVNVTWDFLYGVEDCNQACSRKQLAKRNYVQSTQTKPTEKIDMVNGYHPFVNFAMNFPVVMPRLTEEPSGYLLVVLVNSAARGEKYRRRRAMIRKTWGSHNSCEQQKNMQQGDKLSKLKWLLVFVLGKASPADEEKRNREEARKYNDMLIGNFPDRYVDLIVKFYMGQLWAASLPNVKYTLKVDDDVYLRIPKVIEYLSDAGFPKRFYGGFVMFRHIVQREPGDKWAVSWKYYREKRFPNFVVGAFILLSRDLLTYLFNYVHIRKPFQTEDAYIGVAMRDAKVYITRIKSFSSLTVANITDVIQQRSDCQTLRLVGVAHKLETDACRILHDRVEAMCTKNITLSRC